MERKATGRTTGTTLTGTVLEVLPKAMFQVALSDGRTVRVGLASTARHGMVRLKSGDTVEVRVSAHDTSRGQVIRKL